MIKFRFFILQSFVSVLFLLFLSVFFVKAQTVNELNTKISQKNAEIEKLEREIAQYQLELEGLGKQKNSLSNSIKQLDLNKKKLIADTSITQNKIDKTNLKIKELGYDISGKETLISNNIDALSNEIRNVNEFENSGILVRFLSEQNFAEVWNDIDNISSVNEKIQERTQELKKNKTELEDTRNDTVEAKEELVRLKNKLIEQKKVVDQTTKEKNALLSQTKNNEANYQKLLKEQTAKKEQFERELRDHESQLKFILDPSKLPSAGVLSWPLDNIYVTQEFGAKTGPHRTYASGHSGTDFRARTPLPVKSMADGIVQGVGDTDLACPGASFGKWVFIEYNNGLSSTYGHLSTTMVYEGQKVSRGQVVAYSGGTGRVTGPHLHVSLYASAAASVQTIPSKSCAGKILKQPIAAINAYLDPMYYLPAYKQ